MKGDYGQAFETIKEFMFIKYRGCTIERTNGKFIWGHKIHNTLEEAKDTIDKAYKDLEKPNSINK